MKTLHVLNPVQESTIHYTGLIDFMEIKKAFTISIFTEDVIEKSLIHKANMVQACEEGRPIVPFIMTLRIDSKECIISKVGDRVIINFEEYEIRDGKSKIAALLQLEPELLENNQLVAHIFVVEKDKMDRLESNQL